MAEDKDISPNYDKNNDNLLDNDISVSFEDEKELEKYGVWVKTGPEEIDDIDEISDYNLTDLEDESVISDEEEELLGELEKELSEDNHNISDNLSNSLNDTELDMDISDLDDLEFEELTNTNDIPENKSELEEIVEEEPFDLDIDFDDELNDIEELNINESGTSQPGDNVVLNEDLDLDVLELENLDLDDLELDELELDEIEPDISENKKPETNMENDTSDELDINLENDLDLDVDSLLDNDLDEDLDIDLLLNEETNDFNSDISLEDLDELEDVTDELTEDILDNSSILEESNEEEFDETEKIIEDLTELDDLEETELDDIPESENIDLQTSAESTNIASDILKKIEKELLSIKNELHDVKKELSILKPVSKNESLAENQVSQIEEPGFFEEDEDETIALTGDELDNILNTADIIEETGAETETPDDLLEIDESIDNLDGNALLIDNDDIITIEEDGIIPEIDDSQDLKIDFENDIEEIELLDNESFQNKDIEISEVNSIQEDILLTDLDSLELDPIENNALDISEEIVVDDNDDLNIDEVDLDIEEISFDNEEIDSELEEISFEDEEGNSKLEEISFDNEEIDSELEEISFDNKESDSNIEEISFDNEESDLELGVIDSEFEETIIENSTFEGDLVPEIASEPEGSIPIDMELPEMQEDDNLTNITPQLKTEIKSVLSYMDHLLESLPEDKIDEFANSEHYEVYKKLFEELGLN